MTTYEMTDEQRQKRSEFLRELYEKYYPKEAKALQRRIDEEKAAKEGGETVVVSRLKKRK